MVLSAPLRPERSQRVKFAIGAGLLVPNPHRLLYVIACGALIAACLGPTRPSAGASGSASAMTTAAPASVSPPGSSSVAPPGTAAPQASPAGSPPPPGSTPAPTRPGGAPTPQATPRTTPRPTVRPTPKPTARPTSTPSPSSRLLAHGSRSGREVALTYDMGGRVGDALAIVDWLVDHQVHASIFMTGAMADNVNTDAGRTVLAMVE